MANFDASSTHQGGAVEKRLTLDITDASDALERNLSLAMQAHRAIKLILATVSTPGNRGLLHGRASPKGIKLFVFD